MYWNLQIKEKEEEKKTFFADLEYIRELIKSYRTIYIYILHRKMKDTFEESHKIDVENFQKPQQVPFFDECGLKYLIQAISN